MNIYRQLEAVNSTINKSTERLSTGNRISTAADDACGLAISERMKSRIRGLSRVSKNLQDGISLLQTAEGALAEIQALLQKMRELAVQGATGTSNQFEREVLQQEFAGLKTGIERIINTTTFNTQKILSGSNEAVGAIGIISRTDYDAGTVVGAIANFNIDQKSGVTGTGEISDFNIDVDSVELIPSSAYARFANLTKQGDWISINGFTFEFVENPDNTSPQENYRQVKIGTNAQKSAENLWAAFLGAKLNGEANKALDNISVSVKQDAPPNLHAWIVTFTCDDADNSIPVEKSEGDRFRIGDRSSILQTTFTGGVGEVSGELSFKISSNFTEGDSITIGGVTFTAVTVGSALTQLQFEVGNNEAETALNLRNVLTSHSTLGERFSDNGSKGNIIALKEKTGAATGVNIGEPVVTQVMPALGEYSFEIVSNFRAGETIAIGKQTFEFSIDGAENTVKIGEDEASTAKYLLDALIAGGFFQNNGSSDRIISIKETRISGSDLIEPIIKASNITYASLSFDITSALAVGEQFSIGGVTFEITESDFGNNEGNIAINLTKHSSKIEQAKFIRNYLALLTGFGVEGLNEKIILTLLDPIDGKISDPFVTKATGKDFTAKLQIGIDSRENFIINIKDLTGALENTLSLTEHKSASIAISLINDAIEGVSTERSNLGAYQNRLESSIRNVENSLENLQESQSKIREVDLAKEMMELAKKKIQEKVAIKMLNKVHRLSGGVLGLLS